MATRKQWAALAKAQRAQGNEEAARRAEAKSRGESVGGGTRRKKKAAGGTRRKAKRAAPAATPRRKRRRKAGTAATRGRRAAPRRRAKRRSKNPSATTRTRSRNPSRRRRAKRPAATRRRRSGRSRNPSSMKRLSGGPKGMSVQFSGTKPQLAAMKNRLERAGKGRGQYLNLRTGQLTSARSIKGRSENPSIGSGAIVALAGGVALGAVLAELEFRFLATRATSYDSTLQQRPWVGRAAATRIAYCDGMSLGGIGLTGVAVMGGGWLLMGTMPVLGAVVFGVGLGHVGLVSARLATRIIGGMAGDVKGNELTLANRLVPFEVKAVQDALLSQIAADNDRPQVTDPAATVATLSAQDTLWTDVGANYSLAPLRNTSAPASGTTAGLGATGSAADRIRQVRDQLAGRGQGGTAMPRESQALRNARQAAGLADKPTGGSSIFSAPAVLGCGSDCGCQECSHKHDDKRERPKTVTITTPVMQTPAGVQTMAPPTIEGLAARAAGKATGSHLRSLPPAQPAFLAALRSGGRTVRTG